jgi:hypothetical protein
MIPFENHFFNCVPLQISVARKKKTANSCFFYWAIASKLLCLRGGIERLFLTEGGKVPADVVGDKRTRGPPLCLTESVLAFPPSPAKKTQPYQ